jgi:thiamine biosynthesis lipoprotein ApbE
MEVATMATLLLDNVPDSLLSKLQQLAALKQISVTEATVQLLQQAVGDKPSTGPTLPPEEWVREWRAWVASHKPLPHEVDDDRDSIYAGRGE